MIDSKPTNYLEDIGLWPAGTRVGRAYVIGFGVSLFLTLVAYSIAVGNAAASMLALGALIALACVQFFVQVLCFLHLGAERSSRARVAILCCILFIVTILVVGSLWIMFTLNARQMPDATQLLQYMQSQSGI